MTDILDEREKTHGDAVTRMHYLSRMRQNYRKAVSFRDDSIVVPTDVGFALDSVVEEILGKLTRIACGDPTYADHWRDIIGYAEIGMRCAGIEEADHETAD